MGMVKKILAAVLIAALLTASFAVTALAEQKVKATGDVNVRSGAGLKYKILDTMLAGDNAKYLDKSSKDSRGVRWYKVNYAGTVGWVSSKYSKVTGKKSSSSSSSTQPKGTVKAKVTVNIRSGPSTGFKKLGTLGKGNTAKYLNDKSKDSKGRTWYYVSYGSVKGWVCGSYVTKK